MSCDVRNVMYVIRCLGCCEYYEGQTGRKLRDIRTVNAQQIRDPLTRKTPVNAYLDELQSDRSKVYNVPPLFLNENGNPSARLAKDLFL